MTAAQLELMAAAFDAMAAGAFAGRPEGDYCDERAAECRLQARHLLRYGQAAA